MTGSDEPFTLVFIGHAHPDRAARASAFEDRVLPLLADHGADLQFRGVRAAGEDPAAPLEVHVIRFPHRRAFDAYMADERRRALLDEFGEVFIGKQVVEVDPVGFLQDGRRPGSYAGVMREITLLSSILSKTGDVVAGVAPDQFAARTPCPDFDVKALVDHVLGSTEAFAASANGSVYEGDPTAVRAGDDPAAEFRAAADRLLAGWREHGFDRKVAFMGGEGQPAEMVFNMTLMETLTHGWDLAVASGQDVPYTEGEAAEVLRRAEATLPPQYRGGDMPFGEIVPVPDDAPAVDRLAGFMGRDPAATP